MAVITISRQYESGGDEIAVSVCKTLGYNYFDKKLMAQVAAEAGLREREIVDFSEDNYKVRTFLERLFGIRRDREMIEKFGHRVDEGIGLKTKEVTELDEIISINLVRDTIRAAYKHGNVVIVGRGGHIILKDYPGVLRVRITAPLPARVGRIRSRQQIDLESTEELIIKRDQDAADYLKRFYNIDWNDPTLYDLVINTLKFDPATATNLIINALNYLKFGEPNNSRTANRVI
jgi:cytidylate kinase